jgi:hypothetical protein
MGILAAITVGLAGCAGTSSPIAGLTGTNAITSSVTSIGNISPANLSLALSQDNANDDLTAATPYGNLTVHRPVPGATNTTPVTPLTAAQLAAVQSDPIASFVYGLGRDSASVNLNWQGIGGTVVFNRSMPPNTNAVINVNVVNTSANPVPSVVTTNAPAK